MPIQCTQCTPDNQPDCNTGIRDYHTQTKMERGCTYVVIGCESNSPRFFTKSLYGSSWNSQFVCLILSYFLSLFISWHCILLLGCPWIARKRRGVNIRQKKRELHELPYTEIVILGILDSPLEFEEEIIILIDWHRSALNQQCLCLRMRKNIDNRQEKRSRERKKI